MLRFGRCGTLNCREMALKAKTTWLEAFICPVCLKAFFNSVNVPAKKWVSTLLAHFTGYGKV